MTIHADRGAVPTAADLADLYKALGIERSHSRPHVSDDNRHSGIAFMAPADVHYGRTDAVLAARAAALDAAYAAHPERFVRGRPTPQRPPEAVYINPPIARADAAGDAPDVHVLTDRPYPDAPVAPPTQSRSISRAKLSLQ